MDLTRQDMLMVWLKRHGISNVDIARALEVGQTSVARWLKAERVPEKRHKALLKLGIPAELLPAPLDVAPGPKRRSGHDA